VDAGTWVAIAAAFIAAVAAYFNFQSTRAANRAARAADEQTKIQQRLRIEAAQPYVWADVRGDEVTGTLLNLVVGNSGPSFARNVRLKVEPPLPAIDELRERAETAQALLSGGIGSLGPGRILSWPLGQGFNLIKESGPQAHTFTVTADGPFGPIPALTYVVNIADLRASLDRPQGSLHQLTQAVQGIARQLDLSAGRLERAAASATPTGSPQLSSTPPDALPSPPPGRSWRARLKKRFKIRKTR
jgi:hypothetical protein